MQAINTIHSSAVGKCFSHREVLAGLETNTEAARRRIEARDLAGKGLFSRVAGLAIQVGA